MAFKKYAKKQGKKFVAGAKKRYTTRTGGARVARLAKDLAMVKRQLNVEHKHYDYKFGSGQGVSAQYPYNNDPVFLALTLPVRGTAYNERVGNQIRIVHITSKIEMTFRNNTDLISRTTCSARLLWAKSGDDVPQVEDLYDLDSNGHYTRNSFVNTQTWNKYVWIKPLNTFKSHTDQVNRYPPSNSAGDTILNNGLGAQFNATTVATQPLNLSKYYINKQTKCSLKVMFENGSDSIVSQMKPYLLLMADCPNTSTGTSTILDPVTVTGTIRFTYVDN